MSTHNLCFEQKYEKYQIFLSENFHFLVVKFSVYLNRLVFVMKSLMFYCEPEINIRLCYRPTTSSSPSEEPGLSRFHISIVKIVLELLNTDVRELIKAAIIAANIKPFNPENSEHKIWGICFVLAV